MLHGFAEQGCGGLKGTPQQNDSEASRKPIGPAESIHDNAVIPNDFTSHMTSPERIPKAMAEKFAGITALVDPFCARYLNEEYRQMIHRAVGALARKRPSPLLTGKESVWAAAVVHAVGRVNFLDDPAQAPHCPPKVISNFSASRRAPGRTNPRASGMHSTWIPFT